MGLPNGLTKLGSPEKLPQWSYAHQQRHYRSHTCGPGVLDYGLATDWAQVLGEDHSTPSRSRAIAGSPYTALMLAGHNHTCASHAAGDKLLPAPCGIMHAGRGMVELHPLLSTSLNLTTLPSSAKRSLSPIFPMIAPLRAWHCDWSCTLERMQASTSSGSGSAATTWAFQAALHTPCMRLWGRPSILRTQVSSSTLEARQGRAV